jgi:hypothetical protein
MISEELHTYRDFVLFAVNGFCYLFLTGLTEIHFHEGDAYCRY